MSATPIEEQAQNTDASPGDEATGASTATLDAAETEFSEEDLSIPEEVPTADDPSSRASSRNLDDAGFTLDEFAAFLSKYDHNFKPGDIVTALSSPWNSRAQ